MNTTPIRKMTSEERKYFMGRITEITNEKIEDAKSLIIIQEEVRITDEERYKRLKAGKYKIAEEIVRKSWSDDVIVSKLSKRGVRHDDDIGSILIFDGEIKYKEDKSKYKYAHKRIMDESNRIKDEVMLGGYEKAIKMLETFEKSDFKKVK